LPEPAHRLTSTLTTFRIAVNAVLAIYGALDTRITAGEAAIETAMKQNGKTFDKIICANAHHAFRNDTSTN
jgi:carboxymethylenebutenolidase